MITIKNHSKGLFEKADPKVGLTYIEKVNEFAWKDVYVISIDSGVFKFVNFEVFVIIIK